jgi:hypothetical protein
MQNDSMIVPPRLPLVVLPSNRASSTATDARLVNCYIETNEQGEINIYRRPGMETFETQTAVPGRGLFHWDSDVYSIFSGTMYRNGVSVATGLNTTNGKYNFSSILGATPKMVLGNGAKAYAYWVAGGLTADLNSIDSDYPATTVKGFAYLNGATYVMNPSAVIWGSAINSVSVAGDWPALNFISAQADPDNGIAINKQLVYVIAFNQWTTEVFFDAGNATGSPLGNVQGSIVSYGCAAADSIQSIDDVLFWLCRNKTNSLQIAMMKQLGLEIISTKAIDRLLVDADLTQIMSWQIKFDGHSFYVFTSISLNLTLAYDIVENLWCQWTDANGNYLPIIASTYDSSGRNILQHATAGTLLYMSPDYYTDDDDLIQVDIITPNFDAQTKRRKMLGRMSFIADQVSGSTLNVRYTDNDYQNWSNFRIVDLSQEEPMLTDCGTFKRRAYHLQHKANTFFRISAVELQYDLGTL